MRPRLLMVTFGLVTIILAFVFAHPAPTSGPIFRDFESYYAGGVTWRYGGDPYSREVWRTERTVPQVVATRDELLPFVGPPFGLPFWALLARAPWRGATMLWELVLSASLVTLVLCAVVRGGESFAWTPRFALRVFAALVFSAGFGPLTSGVALGQVAVPACAAIALVPFALRGKRTIAKTLGAGLVASLQPTIALALFARIASARSCVAILGSMGVATLASALALGGYGGLAQYARVLVDHGAAERNIIIQMTVAAVVRGFGAPASLAAAIAVVVALFTVIALVIQCVRGHYAPDDRLLLASAALPLAWPFAHEHDFTIAFVPALVTLARTRGTAWYVAALAAVAVGVDWLGLAQRPSGGVFTVLITLGAGLALAAFAPAGRFQMRRGAAAGVAIVVAICMPFGIAHAVPTWPDALSSNFHVPLAFDAAHTWAAEQLAAGIARLNATSALFRALSLAGSTALWIVASFALRREGTDAVTVRGTAAANFPQTARMRAQ